jgi:hypothetical protein
MIPDLIVKIVLSGFVLLVTFNLGRVDASRAYLRSACDVTPVERSHLKQGFYTFEVAR